MAWYHMTTEETPCHRPHQVRCKSDNVTGARKPIQGDWLTLRTFREMTYAQRQTYLNRIFGLKRQRNALPGTYGTGEARADA